MWAKLFFKRPVLSGDKDTACTNCHLDNKVLTDGLPLAIGAGGIGEGEERLASGGAVVPRNAFTLFARGDSRFKTFFWDCKVQAIDGQIFHPLARGARWALILRSPSRPFYHCWLVTNF